MGNDQKKKYRKNKSVDLPISLREENNSLIYTKCFNSISPNKLHYSEKYYFNCEKIEIDDDSQMNNMKYFGIKNNIDFAIQSDFNFKYNSNYTNNSKKKSKYYVCKYVLFSVRINQDQIYFNNFYKKRFKQIAKSFNTDDNKALELDEIFNSTGFYVPLQVDMG